MQRPDLSTEGLEFRGVNSQGFGVWGVVLDLRIGELRGVVPPACGNLLALGWGLSELN